MRFRLLAKRDERQTADIFAVDNFHQVGPSHSAWMRSHNIRRSKYPFKTD